jgi:CTP synthase
MRFSGLSPDGRLVEIAELSEHPFMLGTQFHPEFLSRPNRPHPLFVAFLKAAQERAGMVAEAEDYREAN